MDSVVSVQQCCGSGSVLDPYSGSGSGINHSGSTTLQIGAWVFSSFKLRLNLEPDQLGVCRTGFAEVFRYFPIKHWVPVLRITRTWSVLYRKAPSFQESFKPEGYRIGIQTLVWRPYPKSLVHITTYFRTLTLILLIFSPIPKRPPSYVRYSSTPQFKIGHCYGSYTRCSLCIIVEMYTRNSPT